MSLETTAGDYIESNLTNYVIQGNTFQDGLGSTAIQLNVGNNITIKDNIFIRSGRPWASVSPLQNSTFVNNTVMNITSAVASYQLFDFRNKTDNSVFVNNTVKDVFLDVNTANILEMRGGGNNFTISNNNFTKNVTDLYMMELPLPNNNPISNSTISFNLVTCTSNNNGNHGIVMRYSQFNNIFSNNVSNCNFGLLSHNGSYYNTFNNNYLSGNQIGLYVIDDTFGNWFDNTTIYNSTSNSLGIYHYATRPYNKRPNNNTLNNFIINNTISSVGIRFTNLTDAGTNTLQNSLIIGTAAVNSTQVSNSSNILLNVTYTGSEVIDDGSVMTREWFFQAKVNYTDGTNLQNVVVNLTDIFGNNISLTTDLNGKTPTQILNAYLKNSSTTYDYNNYTILTYLNGYNSISDSVNITARTNYNPVYTMSTNYTLSSCIPITASGVYNLTGNVIPNNNSAICFPISVSNVIIDGNLFNVSNTTGYNNWAFFFQNQTNITLKNMQMRFSTAGGNAIPVFISNSTNFTINNVKVIDGTDGAYITDSSGFFLNSNFQTTDFGGLFAVDSNITAQDSIFYLISATTNSNVTIINTTYSSNSIDTSSNIWKAWWLTGVIYDNNSAPLSGARIIVKMSSNTILNVLTSISGAIPKTMLIGAQINSSGTQTSPYTYSLNASYVANGWENDTNILLLTNNYDFSPILGVQSGGTNGTLLQTSGFCSNVTSGMDNFFTALITIFGILALLVLVGVILVLVTVANGESNININRGVLGEVLEHNALKIFFVGILLLAMFVYIIITIMGLLCQ